MRYYVGVTRLHNALIFRALPENVTAEKLPEFGFCWGPYRTRQKATQVAMYQNYPIKNGERIPTPILPK